MPGDRAIHSTPYTTSARDRISPRPREPSERTALVPILTKPDPSYARPPSGEPGLAMPVIRLIHCTRCSHPVHPDARCVCGQTHGASRRKARGYNHQAWQDLRQQAINEHPYCAICQSTYRLTGDHLRYPARSTVDIRVLCASCHGRESQAKQA